MVNTTELCTAKKITVPSAGGEEDETLSGCFFWDDRDVALGLALDGFTFYETLGRSVQKTKYNTWSLILINYNLDPTIRTHRKYIMPLGMIPEPGVLKDIGSFLYWLRRELLSLAKGVRSYDSLNQEIFLLRAFLIIVIGDMPAIAHIMDMKGHIGKRPCRTCWIKGKRDRSKKDSSMHYPVLTDSNHTARYTIVNLLRNPRTHKSFFRQAREIVNANTLAKADDLRTHYGLNGLSMLWGLPGINFERSFPHDLMHLIFLNTCPNLVAWWTGTFKDIDTTGDRFQISSDDWKRIGEKIVDSMGFIPAYFIRQLPNIATLGHTYLAEGWCFWLLHIAPYALEGVLPPEYYTHLLDLISIVRQAISFTLTEIEVLTTFQQQCAKWVEDYEQYVHPFLALPFSHDHPI